MKRVGYNVVFNLANFLGIEIERREVNGVMEDVLVLPLRINGFYYSKKRDKKGIYLYGKALPSDYSHRQSHYLFASLSNNIREELTKLGYKTNINFGYLGVIFSSEGKSCPVSTSKSQKIDKLLNQ